MKALTQVVMKYFKQAAAEAEEYRDEPDVVECDDLSDLHQKATASDCWDAGVMFYACVEGKDIYLINQCVGSEFRLVIDDMSSDSLTMSRIPCDEFVEMVMDDIYATKEELYFWATKGAYKRRQAEAAGEVPFIRKYIGFKGVPFEAERDGVRRAVEKLKSSYSSSHQNDVSIEQLVDAVLGNVCLDIDEPTAEILAYSIMGNDVPDDVLSAVLRFRQVSGFDMLGDMTSVYVLN